VTPAELASQWVCAKCKQPNLSDDCTHCGKAREDEPTRREAHRILLGLTEGPTA
jgi:membrane protease subunit (stomatin/prohibitin family)